ncbi:deoxyuridine 5'-triphosphate nucleotidohydrolase-like isoform X2 [Magnolia sinica]|uniref:deoxyuridine 5'-triphosphate nucleotidohydrolase-like isoform X2 n=1 Tax=Magnolia sinica TaxID=86752 RepID=UPI0026582BCD|nr:deoxyuridine 5'-triphosphate nucleotidohydrolase-like isoform X2 [Magnolia sinica]
MGKGLQTSPEIKDPPLDLQELGHNGVSEETQNVSSLLRVKKLSENAVLPSRASPLSAGYDLSSATATQVPARGKAVIPTDLSIGIPQGTYARIGNYTFLGVFQSKPSKSWDLVDGPQLEKSHWFWMTVDVLLVAIEWKRPDRA